MEKLVVTSKEVEILKTKFPGRIPVFVTKASNARDIPDIPKRKFLVPNNISIGQFIWIIRRQIQLPAEKSLFLFVNNTLPTTSSLISELYSIHKSSDGVLHMMYTSENTFGYIFNPFKNYFSSYAYSYSSLQHLPLESPQLVPLQL